MTQPTPDFTFDPRLGGTGRYRNTRTGRVVSASQARDVLDRTLANAADPIQTLSTQLREGNIALEDWRLQMQRQIKDAHLSAASMQRGGWSNMSQADFGRSGQIIKSQYQYLEQFTQDIISGKQRLDGTLYRRAKQYVDMSRATYHKFEQIAAVDRGYTEERSVLNPADHCPGCLEEAAKSWQPIGQMVPLGQRDCRANDKCSVEYRNAAGDVISVDQ